jgi:hypothetical protein
MRKSCWNIRGREREREREREKKQRPFERGNRFGQKSYEKKPKRRKSKSSIACLFQLPAPKIVWKLEVG